MHVQLDEESVIKANSQFWEQMLAMTLDRAPISEKFCVGAGHLSSSVSLFGNWKGRVELRMTCALAYEATAEMLMQPRESLVEADVLDAAKEIANMIGGVLKSSLPRPCSMTVPESAVELEGYCERPRTEDTLMVAFKHPAGDLMVCVWEQECRE
jgi:CheY-specific phosphatase CheX